MEVVDVEIDGGEEGEGEKATFSFRFIVGCRVLNLFTTVALVLLAIDGEVELGLSKEEGLDKMEPFGAKVA